MRGGFNELCVVTRFAVIRNAAALLPGDAGVVVDDSDLKKGPLSALLELELVVELPLPSRTLPLGVPGVLGVREA